MDTTEKAPLLIQLEQSRTAMLDVLDGVSEDTASRHPAPGRWSILDCVEHVIVAEDYLLAQIMTATPLDAQLRNEKREAAIPVRGLDRSRVIESPELAKPSGRFPTLREALQQFLASRKGTMSFVENCAADLRSQSIPHPLFGDVSCYEALLMIAAHSSRHTKQIEECRETLLLPR